MIGVEDRPRGTIAFPAAEARRALASGEPVAAAGVELVADGSGFTARLASGEQVPSHQAFWFAWSQFHLKTAVWRRDG